MTVFTHILETHSEIAVLGLPLIIDSPNVYLGESLLGLLYEIYDIEGDVVALRLILNNHSTGSERIFKDREQLVSWLQAYLGKFLEEEMSRFISYL